MCSVTILSKVKRVAIASIFSVLMFVYKMVLMVLPTPIDKMFIFIQALLFAISSLMLGRMGATYVATISGLLVTIWRPAFAPFSLLFSIMYGILIDIFFYLFKVKMPHGGVKTNRTILSLTVSTAMIGSIALYVTFMISLIPISPILHFSVIVLGTINGAVAGYLTSFIWNRYLRHRS
ncbi:MAG: hypothetical protein N3F06_02790 [Nitrososphaerales archaeon]|nr:hypothetical protein [Nitrososphaerales archaeon]